ncbi:MAG: DUF4136 domain-containing protein, partial [Rhodoferax sp.]|nr:DUF4136 domain-containing protein [Rhodoferax sp.]
IVDSDVTAFATGTGPAITLPAPYRFERLPSQQAQAAAAAALAGLAEPELASASLRRDDAAALYAVQLDLRTFRDPQAPWDDPRYVAGVARPYPFVGRYGILMRHYSLDLRFDSPYYRRELAILVRRLSDGVVVFESRARHDGYWSDDEAVLPAMLRAALQGFPTPAPGPRRVVIEIPR